MWRQIDFTMAVSGAVVGYPLEVVDEEFCLDTEYLSLTFNRHLRHFVVVSGTTTPKILSISTNCLDHPAQREPASHPHGDGAGRVVWARVGLIVTSDCRVLG